MKRLFESSTNNNATTSTATLDGSIVNVNLIKKNTNNDNHHYSFIVCVADQSVVRVTKFLSKSPVCSFRGQLLESMKSGRGASFVGLREANGQLFCSPSTKLTAKDLSFRPNCVRVLAIDSLDKCSDERLCTIEAKVISIGEETSIGYEESEFKRVQRLKKTVIVADKTGALELTLWQANFNDVSLNMSFHMRLVKLKVYNEQISLVAIVDTSFLQIDDIGNVIQEFDRLGVRYGNDEGRIVSIDTNNDQYVCQACGSSDIEIQSMCLFCHVCRSRTAKGNESVDETMNIKMMTDKGDEYSLKISKITMMSMRDIYDQLFTSNIELADHRGNVKIDSSLRVRFQYDQSTGIIHSIVPTVDAAIMPSQDQNDVSSDLDQNNRTVNEKKSSE